ncbi:hypothetical protein BDF20DRAFT_811241, partial [Mycotypha africana]|uniref:uncharacterized protein n=1 Tax=Mycotypha africana TaxID=64632 RepID=UPI00230066F8
RQLPHIASPHNRSQWQLLKQGPFCKDKCSTVATLTRAMFKQLQRSYLSENFHQHRLNTTLLKQCRPFLGVDPILYLPMTAAERSRCIRWRLGWLPNGYSAACPRHPHAPLTKTHALWYLNVYNRLCLPNTIDGPLSLLLDRLPTTRPRSPVTTSSWHFHWPIICQILFELDHPTCQANLTPRTLSWNLLAPPTS